MTTVGYGDFRYELDESWPEVPEGWSLGSVSDIAVDSRDRVFIFNRHKHPVAAFEADSGKFVTSWGEGEFKEPHGMFIDADDYVWTTDRQDHVVIKHTQHGENLLELGRRGWAMMPVTPYGESLDGPFNMPSGVAIAEDGAIFVADGYGNHQVRRFSPEGELELSWGTAGLEPGQFALVHNISIDTQGRILICDREASRIQFFDREGQFIQLWDDVNAPGDTYCSPDKLIYVAEQGKSFARGAQPVDVSIFTEAGELVCRFRGTEETTMRMPHSIWTDSHDNIFVGELGDHGNHVRKFVKI
ncbi:peptidyl-alpha-hydroxyglycine alpha-amidating lyase family protein [Chloroflexi bacterium TSY]|nr:peptidyl-alpha-hydroxyglycine alpha-amidating lyase family protein [Chloroflexi bacterium TSY]